MTDEARRGFRFYQTRPIRVEAAQWFPSDGWRETHGMDALGVCTFPALEDERPVGTLTRGRGEYLSPGDWIVRVDGQYTRLCDKAFHEKYEEPTP